MPLLHGAGPLRRGSGDRLLMPDRLEFAHGIIEEVFPKYGLGRYFIKQGKVFWRDVAFHRAVPLDAQLRVENERDVGRAVFVDLKSGVVRVRRLQRTFTVRLRKQTVEWIRRRLEEDAKLKLAFLGIEKRKDRKELTYGKLYIALVFAREAQPIMSKAIVAVYVNRLDHGMVIGVVKDRKIVKRYRMREVGNRHMQCLTRGLNDARNNIPIHWAKRRYWELLEKTKQPAFPRRPPHF
ncbi:hypothetical protein Pisl_1304 [Pyrobaculum islandicum DSM 4184]|uniref:Uncharacterized protein n=1 Tax=Pyrobaculum islandicum (strain DSM 4184 / JCM 9189 / GEO3) TaxID=384616 RepID=A1RU35_PYRIL|nr:hypothetical protein Pisl_1304 [Pyrobaculum islandicum DSM 4184]